MDEMDIRVIGILQWEGWTGTLGYSLDYNTYCGQLVSSPDNKIDDCIAYTSDAKSTARIYEEFKNAILDYKNMQSGVSMDF